MEESKKTNHFFAMCGADLSVHTAIASLHLFSVWSYDGHECIICKRVVCVNVTAIEW